MQLQQAFTALLSLSPGCAAVSDAAAKRLGAWHLRLSGDCTSHLRRRHLSDVICMHDLNNTTLCDATSRLGRRTCAALQLASHTS